MVAERDPFGARATLAGDSWTAAYYRVDALANAGFPDVSRLPFTIKILLENVLRRFDGYVFTEEAVRLLAGWNPQVPTPGEFPFLPSRVLMQDFTGVPAVVDLAAMRSAVQQMGGDPQRINPLVPADLVVDHSVQVDAFGTVNAFAINVEREYERNRERYELLRWAQKAFLNFRVVPPGTGIIHQVNIEHLAGVVHLRQEHNEWHAYPDTLVGTDSHTTMVNGLGCLGWGVGGIEAEAALLGQPMYLLTPQVIGFRLHGALREGATATDAVLTVTQMLRAHGVVDKFVEFFGVGLSSLTLADRATISNMCPEYGATAALFPVDDETLKYLRLTARSAQTLDIVERYCKEQGIFRTDATPEPVFSEVLELDLASVEPSLAGPRLPQQRVALSGVREGFRTSFSNRFHPASEAAGKEQFDTEGGTSNEVQAPSELRTQAVPTGTMVDVSLGDGISDVVGDGSVVIAAITSCTNTSNPTVMIGAGLVAKKAVERGMQVKPHVKTSLAPGSRAVTEYLKTSGVLPYLEALRFHVVGYGCTTCIGNSGPLAEPIGDAITGNDLAVAAVLSGNRNFEGRIHPLVRASYLASPPLVVAYALAGTVDIDLTREPLGRDATGEDVYLRDIWPTTAEVAEVVASSLSREIFEDTYAHVFAGDEPWKALNAPSGALFEWDPESTYVREPPFFQDLAPKLAPLGNVTGARVLAVLGDSVTTDHISPAGSIERDQPAGEYLISHGVDPHDFNSFGSRRGNHEVMMRGTFANVRLRNEMTPGREGDWAVHLPDGEVGRIFDVSQRYVGEGTPLVVLAGKEYGSGSSRDWAAKGPVLLGVKAVIAESFERIHRSNLVGMGVLPLVYKAGENRQTLGLDGTEVFDIVGIDDNLQPRQDVTVRAKKSDGSTVEFKVTARVDSPIDVDYLKHGGVLQMVLRNLVTTQPAAS
ncbi:MAG: aconitate hydratase [Chloroflexota bacterium]|jgi:aconitate hydratase|nr:aconitate hydratase [Chloroflexota bacterium]